MKSVFIVSVPKSGSSVLQAMIAKSINFKNCRELLNPKYNTSLPYHQLNSDYHSLIRNILMPMKKNCVVKEVAQTQFVLENIEWMLEHFNVIFLSRKIGQILKSMCFQQMVWKGVPQSIKILESLASKHLLPIIRFDSLWNFQELCNLLHKLYDIKIDPKSLRHWEYDISRNREKTEIKPTKELNYWKNIKYFEQIHPTRDMSTKSSITEIPKRIQSYVKNKKILDFGCGLGRLINDLHNNETSANWDLTGFDLPNIINLCQKNLIFSQHNELSSNWDEIKKRKFDVNHLS